MKTTPTPIAYHAEPRHPNAMAVFFPSHLSPARALMEIANAFPHLEGKKASLLSGPAWHFSPVDLTPEQARQAAIASATSRLETHQVLQWPEPEGLRDAVNSALLSDSPASLANLIQKLDA